MFNYEKSWKNCPISPHFGRKKNEILISYIIGWNGRKHISHYCPFNWWLYMTSAVAEILYINKKKYKNKKLLSVENPPLQIRKFYLISFSDGLTHAMGSYRWNQYYSEQDKKHSTLCISFLILSFVKQDHYVTYILSSANIVLCCSRCVGSPIG